MDDHIGFQFLNSFAYRRSIRDVQLDIRRGNDGAPVIHAAINRLNIRACAFIGSPFQLIDHIMAKLSSNACYKYLHGITCFAPSSNSDMATAQQPDYYPLLFLTEGLICQWFLYIFS